MRQTHEAKEFMTYHNNELAITKPAAKFSTSRDPNVVRKFVINSRACGVITCNHVIKIFSDISLFSVKETRLYIFDIQSLHIRHVDFIRAALASNVAAQNIKKGDDQFPEKHGLC